MTKRKATRAAHGAGSIRKRADGRWEGTATVGRDPLTGKHIRKSVYGKTQAEAREKLTQITAAVDDGTFTEPSKLSVSQWLDVWAAEYLEHVKSRTVYTYKSVCNLYLKPAIGPVKLTSLSAHTIQTLYNNLGREKGLSPKTVKNAHGVLRKALQQAVELDYLRSNPAAVCKLPRIEKPAIKPLDDDATTAFLAAIDGHRWGNLYLVTLFTGMRQGEALGLSWPSVDFEKGSILIKQQLQRNRFTAVYEIGPIKNDKSRSITPAPSVMAALREQKRLQAGWRLMAGGAWENEYDLVFTTKLGGHLVHNTVWKSYKKIVASIGLPAARFHDLRHSYAVASLQAGDDIKTVQENLGHHTAAFTLDTYAHVTEKMKQDSAARMEQYIADRKAGK